MSRTTKTTERFSISVWVIIFGVLAILVSWWARHEAVEVLKRIPADRLSGVSTGLIVGSVSLLLTLASRNISISDRVRGLSQEINSALVSGGASRATKTRIEVAASQLELFRSRYSLNQLALGAQFLTTPCVVAGVGLAMCSGPKERLDEGAAFILGGAVFLFVFGAVATLVDLCLAQMTLRTELRAAIASTRLQRLRLDSQNADAVIHFNRIFHELWFRDGLGAFQASFESGGQAGEIGSLVLRYYGLHQEQYYFFMHGLLPREVYAQWLEFLRLQMDQKPSGSESTFKQQFSLLADNESEEGFRTHIQNVMLAGRPISKILNELEEKLEGSDEV